MDLKANPGILWNHACPFGSGWCMVENPCPLHDTLFGMKDHSKEVLEKNIFAIFCTVFLFQGVLIAASFRLGLRGCYLD